MSDSLTSESEYVFSCDCDESMRSACEGEIFYGEHKGNRYCVFHFPGPKAKFWDALDRKLERNDLDFRGGWFPDAWSSEHAQFARDANFSSAHFESEVDFTGASFSGTADFSGATFKSGAYFAEVNFQSVDFSRATFRGTTQFNFSTFAAAASFQYCKFQSGVGFGRATFEKEVDFHGVTFSQETHLDLISPLDCANFQRATFRGRVEFGVARFNGVTRFNDVVFEGVVDLSNSVFGGLADFTFATFGPIAFMHCVFKSKADFRYTTLNALTQFERATFNAELDFSDATFQGSMHFRDTTFRDHAKFAGHPTNPVVVNRLSWDLQFARIEKPDHFSFHTLRLSPHWFVNTDPRKFDFTNVNWDCHSINKEIKSLQRKRVLWSHRMLSTACRLLAVNAEENHRYEDASKLRYMAMDARRREKWRGFAFWKLSWWYWLASGYGERAARAFVVLLVMLVLFAAFYTQVGFVRWEPRLASESDVAVAARDGVGKALPLSRALAYSAAVMTFQKPEPRPATTAAQTVVLLETILGPVQAALLALAIRRKFMR